jgi:oxygen-independent coproporphyrinogen-3 oxidase
MASTDAPLSLYLHIPFCERKCIYCDFYSIEDLSPQREFVALLRSEIDLKLEAFPKYKGRSISTLFFGGGTPSLLSPEELSSIVSKLKEYFVFASDIEFTLECNPGTVTLEKLQGYRLLGANRLSFGVQSFHEDELTFLSRIHDANQAREAISLARVAGFESVNLDLIFALPNQTKEKLKYSIDEALNLGIDHISAYNLIVEEGTPLNRMVKLGQVGELGVDDAAELMSYVQERLSDAGYEQYEISNYARSPEHRCKHNLVYWDGFADYMSFGPSAHEFLDGTRSWNISSLDKYGEMIKGGKLPRNNSETVSAYERRTEVLYCQLRSTGIVIDQFNSAFDEDILRHSEIVHLLQDEMLVEEDGRLCLTQRGYRYCDAVVVKLMNVSEHI